MAGALLAVVVLSLGEGVREYPSGPEVSTQGLSLKPWEVILHGPS